MRTGLRFVMPLVIGLAVLASVTSLVVNSRMHQWFDKDVRLRTQLAMSGSRRSLVGHWRQGAWTGLHDVLADVARDERIMSAAACSPDLRLLASTEEFPERFSCTALGGHVRAAPDVPAAAWVEWKLTATLPGGSVLVNAIPVIDEGRPLGFVVLIHDMSFVERREAQTRRFLLTAFILLGLAASVWTVVASRMAWRGWTDSLRRVLRGGVRRPHEFQPLLQDVRELVDRLTFEKEIETGYRYWTADRLKQLLERQFQGERIVVVANREPYIHERRADGRVAVIHPASGLVTALEPVMRACSGVWIAHGGGSADRETSDRDGRVNVPPGEDVYVLRRIWLTEEEERGYYYGFANEGLWPLCHIAHTRPRFRLDDWRYYQAVNRKFADAVCEEVDAEDPIILVQDYHFALVPALIRERLPRATIISFWHIPWPNAESFGICPFRDELLQGMLGSSILGFHTQLHCNNFIDAVERYMEARVDREDNSVVLNRRSTQIRPYPISIEWPGRWEREVARASDCRASVLSELGLPGDALLGLGVDRLDYTKGIEERLLAVERLHERFPSLARRLTFIQLAAPSRTAIDRYRELGDAVEAVARRVNERFGTSSYRPVVLLKSHHEPAAVLRYYRAVDVCYVSSLHDGMNLVAKEFVAARDDERGVLVLSSFTGAARELGEALIVNPYDIEEASAALASALRMPAREQQERMRAMRLLVSEFNVYRWAGRLLIDAARLRRHDRLADRLAAGIVKIEGVV